MNCICGHPSVSRCAKCTVGYCSRDCQVKDWPVHKTKCQGTYIKLFLHQAYEFMAGNVHSMLKGKLDSHVVCIEIPESLEKFMRGGNFHMAHLHLVKKSDWDRFMMDSFGKKSDCDGALFVFNNFTSPAPVDPLRVAKAKVREGESLQTVTFQM